jgi:hypothetical protein
MRDLLAPDGHAFIWVPDLAEPGRWPFRTFHSGHLFGFTYETLMMMGGHGVISVTANVAPALMAKMCAARGKSAF